MQAQYVVGFDPGGYKAFGWAVLSAGADKPRLISAGSCAKDGHPGTVNHVNSLRGACLVEGILATRFAHEQWPSALVTEAHPKALLLLSTEAREFLNEMAPYLLTEHEKDAVVAAWSALALVRQTAGWRDLVVQDDSPFFPAGGRAAYWFPSEPS